MTSKIGCVVNQAVITFSKAHKSSDFYDNLVQLKRNTDELDAPSVGLDLRLLRWDVHELNRRLHRKPGRVFASHRRVPVTYIRVFEDKNVSIGLFVLRNGAKIPFHDHPNMHGLLKVIYGKVKIQSFTTAAKDYGSLDVGCSFDAVKLPSITVDVAYGSCMLYPEEGNIHQVTTVDGPAVILDVLGPPYDAKNVEAGKRYCSYFKKTNHSDSIQLTIIREPENYWCDSGPYTGPRFSINVDGKNK